MTRRFPRWPVAIALFLASASVAAAQAPMVPSLPPSPPVATPPASPVIPPAKKAPAPPGVAAIVNGKKILRYQVANEALKIIGPEQVLNQMILIELINQEAAKQAISITPAEVAARVAETEKQYTDRGVPGGFPAVLAQRGLTLAGYKDQLTTEMKVEALVSKTLPPTTPVMRYHIRHLLIQTQGGPAPPPAPGAKPPHTDAEAKALIAKAQAELKAGTSFIDVANKYTEDPSGQGKGGDLGIIDSTSPLVPVFLTAALALKPGQVTPTPVKSEFGYHLIEMDSSSQTPLASDRALYEKAAAGDRLKNIQQAIPAYVRGLRSKAKVVDYLAAP